MGVAMIMSGYLILYQGCKFWWRSATVLGVSVSVAMMVGDSRTSSEYHTDSSGCLALFELYIVSAVVATMSIHCYGHVAHCTSPLHPSVWSLRDVTYMYVSSSLGEKHAAC